MTLDRTRIPPRWFQVTISILVMFIAGCGGGGDNTPAVAPPATDRTTIITGVIQDRFDDGRIRVNDFDIQLPLDTLARNPDLIVGVPVRITLSHEGGVTGPITISDDDDDPPHDASDVDVIDRDDEEVRIKGLVTSLSRPNFAIDAKLILVSPDTEFEIYDEGGILATTRAAFYNNLQVGARAVAEGYEAGEGVLAEEVTVWLSANVPPTPPPVTSSSPIILAGPVSAPFDSTTNRFTILTVPIEISATTVIQPAPGSPTALQPGRRVECRGDLVNGVVHASLITLDKGPEPGGVLVNAPLETLTVATRRATALGLTIALDRGVRIISREGIASDITTTLSQWRAGDRIVALGVPKSSQPRWIQTTTIATTSDSAQTVISEQSPVVVIGPVGQSYDPASQSLVVADHTFQITAQTNITLGQASTPASPATLTTGTEINLSGFQLDSRFTAEKIEVLTIPLTHIAIAGPYEAFDPATRRLSVLGHLVEYSGATLYYDFAGLQVSLSDFVLAAPAGTVILATGTRDASGVLHAVRLTEIEKVYSASVASSVKVAGTLTEPFNLATLSLAVANIPVAMGPTIAVRQPDGTPAQPVTQLITGDPVVINGRLGQAGFVADDIVRLFAVTGAVELTSPTQYYDAATRTFFLLGQALRITPNTAVNTIGMPSTTADDLALKLTPWTRLHVLTQIPTPDQPSWDALAIEARLFFPHAHPAQVTGQVVTPLNSVTGTLNILGATVAVNAQTRVLNALGNPIDSAALTSATPVIVNGYINNSETMTAETIQVLDATTSWSPQLGGPVLWTNPVNQTVNVLGSTVRITATTRLLESVTVALTAQEFWTGVSSHSLLQVQGSSMAATQSEVTAEEILVVRY